MTDNSIIADEFRKYADIDIPQESAFFGQEMYDEWEGNTQAGHESTGFHAGFRTGELLGKIEVLEELKNIVGIELHFRSIEEKLKALAKINSMLSDLKNQ